MKDKNKKDCYVYAYQSGRQIRRHRDGFFRLFPSSSKIILSSCSLLFCICFSACKKLVDIPQPINSVTSTEIFSSDATATSALVAIYSNMSWGGGNRQVFSNSQTTLNAGVSSDELTAPNNNSYQTNTLSSSSSDLNSQFWAPAYRDIYMANGVITGLDVSKTVTQATKNQLTGEADFIRAYCYFYLVNLFGDVPLVLTTDWTQTTLMSRTPSAQIYQQIIADLKNAQGLLPGDYSISNGDRTRANKWAATALLARAYLYTGDWVDAEKQATLIINNTGTYNLTPNLNEVFLMNNNEAILQLQTIDNGYYATLEGHQFIPPNASSSTKYYLTKVMLNAFETGDQRRSAWIDSSVYAGITYYYPYKYKVRTATTGNITEYYTLLRFAEQYLIRAEAEAQLQNPDFSLNGAIGDLNTIRLRAGLPKLPATLNQTQVIAAIAQERRIELFAEWGHRWFDLKRWGIAAKVLSADKGFTVSSNALLWPIPVTELKVDPNLTQNPGYQ